MGVNTYSSHGNFCLSPLFVARVGGCKATTLAILDMYCSG